MQDGSGMFKRELVTAMTFQMIQLLLGKSVVELNACHFGGPCGHLYDQQSFAYCIFDAQGGANEDSVHAYMKQRS